MQINLLWTGREYYSLENCLATIADDGLEITSTIIGLYREKMYQVDYRIKTNKNGATIFAGIHSRHNNQMQRIRLEGDGQGRWMYNGRRADNFDGCLDVDIPLTPFTNTLPIRRLQLNEGQSQQIRIIYCDILQQQIKSVSQKYTRLADEQYRYQNVPNDFEATIKVDEFGLVIDYPQLFVRSAAFQYG